MSAENPITQEEINNARALWVEIAPYIDFFPYLFTTIKVHSPEDNHEIKGFGDKLWVIPILMRQNKDTQEHRAAFRAMISEMEAELEKFKQEESSQNDE